MGIVADNHQNHHHINFHFHFPHLHHHHQQQQQEKKGTTTTNKEIPKGCVAIMVGHGEEEQQRFVIPVMYINHPLFMELLKEAEEEFGYDHVGPITIPCQVEEFRNVQGIIEAQDHLLHHHHHHLCFI